MAVRMRSLLRVSASIGALIVLIAAMVWTSRQETVSVLMDGVGESPTYKGPMVPEVGQDVDIEEANVEENLPLGQLLEIIPEEPAVEMSLETQELMASLEYELDTWTTLVESKLNHTIPNLQREIDRFVQDLIMQCDNGTWSGLMAEFDAIERNESSQLESFVEDISCVGRLDPETNEMVYIRSHGGQIVSQYVTRPLIDSLINKSLQLLETKFQNLSHVLDTTFPSRLQDGVVQIKQERMDMFEMWAESVFTEWSERMAQNDLLFDQDTIPLPFWRQFMGAKTHILDTHVELHRYEPDIKQWTHFMDQCREHAEQALSHAKSHLQVLNVQASDNFKSREEAESAL